MKGVPLTLSEFLELHGFEPEEPENQNGDDAEQEVYELTQSLLTELKEGNRLNHFDIQARVNIYEEQAPRDAGAVTELDTACVIDTRLLVLECKSVAVPDNNAGANVLKSKMSSIIQRKLGQLYTLQSRAQLKDDFCKFVFAFVPQENFEPLRITDLDELETELNTSILLAQDEEAFKKRLYQKLNGWGWLTTLP